VALEFAEPARRHLAIIDQSRLRRDCLKLALSQQPRRWRVTDVPLAMLAPLAGAEIAAVGGGSAVPERATVPMVAPLDVKVTV